MARSVIALVACMVAFLPLGTRGQVREPMAEPRGMEDTHATRFDIAGQHLAEALRLFSEQSGIAVLVDDALVEDRQSPGVHVQGQPREVLRLLLEGTGLEAHFTSANAFTVTAAAEPDGSRRTTDAVLAPAAIASIQAAIETTLCAHVDTRPGGFRLALQVWLDDAGSVVNAVALAASNDGQRDARILATLRGVRLPRELAAASPLTLLLLPSAPGVDPCRVSRDREG